MEAVLMKRIRLRGSGILYKIYNIYFAPNCPGRIVLRRIVREPIKGCPRWIWHGPRQLSESRPIHQHFLGWVGNLFLQIHPDFTCINYHNET